MANLPEESVWTDGIYQLEEGDPVRGGPEGVSNVQAKQLGDRTRYLKALTEELAVRGRSLSSSFGVNAGSSVSKCFSQINGVLTDGVKLYSSLDIINFYWNEPCFYWNGSYFASVGNASKWSSGSSYGLVVKSVKAARDLYAGPWTEMTRLSSIKEIGALFGIASDGGLYLLKSAEHPIFLYPDASFFSLERECCVFKGVHTFFAKSGEDTVAIQLKATASGLSCDGAVIHGKLIYVGDDIALFLDEGALKLYLDVSECYDLLAEMPALHGGQDIRENLCLQDNRELYLAIRDESGRVLVWKKNLDNPQTPGRVVVDEDSEKNIFCLAVFDKRPDDIVLTSAESLGSNVLRYFNKASGELTDIDLHHSSHGPFQHRLGRSGLATGSFRHVGMYNPALKKVQSYINTLLGTIAYVKELDAVVMLGRTQTYAGNGGDNANPNGWHRVLAPNLTTSIANDYLNDILPLYARNESSASFDISNILDGILKAEAVGNMVVLTKDHRFSIIGFME
jgi:hypothetical protein